MGAVKPRKANRMLNDMKLAIEHDGMNKNKFATQMEELRRAADQETTNHNAAETKRRKLVNNNNNNSKSSINSTAGG